MILTRLLMRAYIGSTLSYNFPILSLLQVNLTRSLPLMLLKGKEGNICGCS